MKPIRVIENYYSKLLCAFLNTPALTLGRYILLGCYQDRYETLLHETTHFFRYQTNKWYIFEYIKNLILRKEKFWLYNIEPVTSEILYYTHIKGEK